MKHFTNYQILDKLLSQIVWVKEFAHCLTVDDYANVFTAKLLDAINVSSYYMPLHKRVGLPKHIIKLISLKKRLWKRAIISNDYAAFMQARRNVQAAIRHFRRNQEHRLICSNNRKQFYDHIYHKCCAQKGTPRLTCDGEHMSDQQSAEILLAEFASNF